MGEAEVGGAGNHVLASCEVEVNLLQKLLLWGVRVWRLSCVRSEGVEMCHVRGVRVWRCVMARSDRGCGVMCEE